MNLTKYSGVGLLPAAESTGNTISTLALLAVEGPIDDKARDKVFEVDELERMARATNDYLETGRSTNLYLSEHSAQSGDFVGKLRQGLYTKEIASEDLPDPGMQELIGRVGLFGPIDITVQRGIEVYNGGLRTISVGHDEDGSFLGKDVIGEVSLTSFPAIYGASLYSKTFQPTTTTAGNLLLKGLSSSDKDAIATYGLTIAQSRQEMAIASESNAVYEDFEAFLATISDINSQNADPSLVERAIDDLAAAMRSRLNPDPLVPPLPPSTFAKEKPMPDELETTDRQPDLSTYQKQVDDLTANNARLAEELNQMKMRQLISSHYSRLRNQGESLIRQYKLTPAQFKATFSDNAETDIDKFLNPPDGEEGKYSLSNVEYHFSNLEQYGAAVAPVATDEKPQEIADPNQDKYDAELATYRKSRGYATKEAN